MNKLLVLLFLTLFACSPKVEQVYVYEKDTFDTDLILSFGSCNNQRIKNVLFKEILKNKPKAFIWGGDIVYSDTDNPKVLQENFEKFKKDSTYAYFRTHTEVLGTWDDHDYGRNDGGFENPIKKEAQQLFLDFLDVNTNNRTHQGVYSVKTIQQDSNAVKIINLDTRYFRTALTKDTTGIKRYVPNDYGEGTMLGKQQWLWLENELNQATEDFIIINSSIQFLSDKHGFEAWGNMPHEVAKLEQLILNTKAKNVIILSGDRHIAEISKKNIGLFKYPLIDFTSSGLTHAYTGFSGEENPFRVSRVIHQINFGLLKFDFKHHRVLFEIRGKDNQLLEKFTQHY